MGPAVVPAADGDLVRLLESANHVCRALDLVRSASVSEYDRDVAELRRRLADFDGRRRELVEEIDRDGGARPEWADLLHRDEPDEDLDDDPDDEMDGDPDDDEATLEALLRRGDDDGDDSDVDGDDEHAGVDESWEAVVDVAEAVFGPHGSALGWARDAWRMLDAAGLTSFEGHVERRRAPAGSSAWTCCARSSTSGCSTAAPPATGAPTPRRPPGRDRRDRPGRAGDARRARRSGLDTDADA